MIKNIVLSLSLIILGSLFSGFALSRSSRPVSIKMHIKDLPQHNLRLIGPSDPSFDERLSKELKEESKEVIDTLKPFSVFLENKAESPVVAYLIQWCFTRADGRNEYYRKAVLNPQALTEGENFGAELTRQSGRIEHNSAILLSLLSSDGSGILRTEVSAKEAEEYKQGKKLDRSSLLERFSAHASQFTEITVSLDAAFFDDGTFVGPDTTNFFNQSQAVIDARRDFLNELAVGLSQAGKARDSLYAHLQETAGQPIQSIESSSTPTDYYNYFKKLSASEFLQMKSAQGEDQAIAMALRQKNKPWATLRKKN